MTRIIAGTYELIREIGLGGGGIIYLANHLRLDKHVVLKADKRKLTAKPETLRREIDTLKNLSHQYIPQVYDFVVEDETAYTVMDYIEGESFDKRLKNGERFTQSQVVYWACQLLEALSYLHSRPPHGILHADIKPANVMLTPHGDIRIIDFNAALALGEEGAAAVGRSSGYASPEHLGLDFSAIGAMTRSSARSDAKAMTILDLPETVLTSEPMPQISATSGKKIMLDARSDIYGLGATLYHILTGSRPAGRISEIVPLSDKEFSRGSAAIINRAMNPNPDLRFQSADEMLRAFRHLSENDPHTRHEVGRVIV
ncbi:MAG: serine/threonine protein kinase [Oscillospiraceae bacterium]|jgi:serine/threonine protein kinase|nr:serine/threonine protein kinase [Oscillospiraceae bacterium]